MAPLPEAPPDEPAVTFGGLRDRTRQAIANAAKTGAQISVVMLDRNTGEVVSGGDDASFPIASVVKLFIADDLLLQESKGETELSAADRRSLDVMLRSSDDSAAENFWNRSGGSDIVNRVAARYGLANTKQPYNGKWDLTTSTAGDLVRYYDKLLSGSGGLPPEQANVIMANLAQSTPTGIDGYPQRFGIPEVRCRARRRQTGVVLLLERRQPIACVDGCHRPRASLRHGHRIAGSQRRSGRARSRHPTRQDDVPRRPYLALAESVS